MCYQAGVVGPVYTAHVTVRHDELDRFGRLHPAVYLRYLAHAAVEASTAAGYDAAWYRRAGAMWLVRRSTLEYLEGARYGDQLGISTWFAWAPAALDAHQRIARAGGERPLVRVSTGWRWVAAAGGAPLAAPDGVRAALGPLLAA